MLMGNLAVHPLHELAVQIRVLPEHVHHVLALQLVHDRAAPGADGGETALLSQHAVFPEILAFVHHVDLLSVPVQDQGHAGLQEEHPIRRAVDGADVLPVIELEPDEAGTQLRHIRQLLGRSPHAEKTAQELVVDHMCQGVDPSQLQ